MAVERTIRNYQRVWPDGPSAPRGRPGREKQLLNGFEVHFNMYNGFWLYPDGRTRVVRSNNELDPANSGLPGDFEARCPNVLCHYEDPRGTDLHELIPLIYVILCNSTCICVTYARVRITCL